MSPIRRKSFSKPAWKRWSGDVSERVLVIKMNLLPWYNELDDHLEVYHPTFPEAVRQRILTFGEFRIISINRLQTRIRRIPKKA